MHANTWPSLWLFLLVIAFPSCNRSSIVASGLSLLQPLSSSSSPSSSVALIQRHALPTFAHANNKRSLQSLRKQQSQSRSTTWNRLQRRNSSEDASNQQRTCTPVSTIYHAMSLWIRMNYPTNLKGKERSASLHYNKTVRFPRAATTATAATIGFWGHGGLFLASILLVKTVYATWFNKLDSVDQSAPAGILNRCPWPFVIFHDPKQFLKDSPTWVMVTWLVLWRLVRMIRR